MESGGRRVGGVRVGLLAHVRVDTAHASGHSPHTAVESGAAPNTAPIDPLAEPDVDWASPRHPADDAGERGLDRDASLLPAPRLTGRAQLDRASKALQGFGRHCIPDGPYA